MSRNIGTVRGVTRFPVKSMAGETVAAAEIDWQGLEGDRQYGFLKRGNSTRFPWFTGRDLSALVRYRPAYETPDHPRSSLVAVRTPDDQILALSSPELRTELERMSGDTLELIQLGIGAYDLMPVSVVTTASLRELDERYGTPLDHRRFRANILIDSEETDRDWQGCRLSFGIPPDGAELHVAYGAPRCAMVTIDPDDGTRDPVVLRTIAQAFGNAFTMYTSVARPGIIRAGDAITLTC